MVGSRALVTGLPEQSDGPFTAFLPDYIEISGLNHPESPSEIVINDCLRVGNASMYSVNMSKRHARNSQMAQETTQNIPSHVLEILANIENAILFSSSQEGVIARESHGRKVSRCSSPARPFLLKWAANVRLQTMI